MRRVVRLAAVSFLIASVSACASSAATSAARRGDDAALRAAIASQYAQGKLDDGEAADIAEAVLVRALAEAKGDEALERVRDARPCALAVASALRDRAETHDDAGAAAALALLEVGEYAPGDARKYVQDASDAWRAVGARGLVREDDRDARLSAMVDPSARVRRSAVRASADAKDERDVDALFEAARVDPEPLVRSEAVRALGRLDAGGSAAVNELRDVWNVADDPLREDIAVAYTSPHLAAAGGAEAVRVLVASGHGPGVISAAAALLRARTDAFDAETKRSAVGLLVRSIDLGSRRDRLFAMAIAKLDEPDLLAAMKRATACSDDLDVRLSAYVRLLEVPRERAAAMKELYAFAGPAVKGPLGQRARLALADAGELRIQAWIEEDLKSEDGSARLTAAQALSALNRSARGAPLLADADPRVRARAACTILAAVRQ